MAGVSLSPSGRHRNPRKAWLWGLQDRRISCLAETSRVDCPERSPTNGAVQSHLFCAGWSTSMSFSGWLLMEPHASIPHGSPREVPCVRPTCLGEQGLPPPGDILYFWDCVLAPGPPFSPAAPVMLDA